MAGVLFQDCLLGQMGAPAMKPGRPRKSEQRPPLKTIAVRLPPDLLDEIDRRVAALSSEITGRRSAVVRDALRIAFAKTPSAKVSP